MTETADGSSSVVDVVTGGSPQTVTISANGTATADLSDTYTEVSGSLKFKDHLGSCRRPTGRGHDQGELRRDRIVARVCGRCREAVG